MTFRKLRGYVAFALAVIALSACKPADVKDVLNDKEGYLNSEFSADQLPKNIQSEMSSLDQTPVNFQRLVMKMSTSVELPLNTQAKPDLKNVITVINAGNGLVKSIEEMYQNGIPSQQDYQLTYRGLFVLRNQSVVLNRQVSNFIVVAKSMPKVDPFLPRTQSNDTFEYDRLEGTSVQLMGFLSSKLICTWKGIHPASDVNALFTGDARDMECQFFNNNGVLTSRTQRTYLMNYGLVLTMSRAGASYNTTFKVDTVSIE